MALNKRIDLIMTGQLRIGRNASAFVSERAGLGLNFKINKYLSLSPSYQHIANQPTPRFKQYETRLSFAATIQLPLERFKISNRNLFERRLREPSDSSRYRNRLQIERLLRPGLSAFLSDEVSYDWSFRGWTRNRLAAGISKEISKTLTLDLYYLRQWDGRSRPGDLHVIGSAFKIRL